MFFWDPTYILVLIGAGICLLASARVKNTFNKYAKMRSSKGLTGREVAEQLLRQNGLYDVQVQHVAGELKDHYDPKTKTVRLSDSTYNSTSVAAVGVAAHECGHAMQHATGYHPITVRGALVPVVNLTSMAAWPIILIGLFIGGESAVMIINIGILLFSTVVLFHLITLPVEFNASSRAIHLLDQGRFLEGEELQASKKVLSAAALTYVASAAAMILQLLRLVLLRDRRR